MMKTLVVLSLLISRTVAFKSQMHGFSLFPSPCRHVPLQHHRNTRLYVSTGFGLDRDVYDVLGVSYDADMKKIKSAYRRLAKKYHPDANSQKDTTKEFQEINNAYELIKDEIQRAIEESASRANSWSGGVGPTNGGQNGFGFGRYDKVDKTPYQASGDSPFDSHTYSRASAASSRSSAADSSSSRYDKVDPSPHRWSSESPFDNRSRYDKVDPSSYRKSRDSPFDVGSHYDKVDASSYQRPNESPFDNHSLYGRVDPSPYRYQKHGEGTFDFGSRYASVDTAPYRTCHHELNIESGPRHLKRDNGVRDQYRSVRFDRDHRTNEYPHPEEVSVESFRRPKPPRSTSVREKVRDREPNVKHGAHGSFSSRSRPSNDHGARSGRKQQRNPSPTSDIRSRTRGGVMVGDDIRTELEIDSNTGRKGGNVKVFVRHVETCRICDGSGARDRSRIRSCSACGGAVHTAIGAFQEQQACRVCRGTGQEIGQTCSTCVGEGTTKQTTQIMVTVPPGTKDGSRLHIPGEGNAGPNGGPPGDLYVYVTIKRAVPDVEVILKKERRPRNAVSTTVPAKEVAERAKQYTSNIERVSNDSKGGYFAKTWRWMKNTLIPGRKERTKTKLRP